jgi:two-component system sensor histidine kinase MtrB
VVPPALRELVEQEKLGYQFTTIDETRTLVFGAPLPPEGVDLYLFYPLADIDETLSLLARVLFVVGVAGLVVASLLALRVSRRILLPLGAVSAAAHRVAEGLLETRVEAPSEDELGVLAASFNEMASALQEMIVRERRFVANVSHELRTPLATLEATSGLIAAHRDELSAPGREAVDLIVEDVSGLRRLVEELLEVSELDAGRAKVAWEEVELRALAQAIMRRRRREDVPVIGEPVSTFADKARLDRVLGNLVDNALEHGRGEGVRLEIGRDDGACHVTVRDRGPGIPAEDLPRVFERFFKADSARSREQGGVGLGLALALENARLMGGTIDVESEPEGGSTFTLRLPMRSAPPEGGTT